MANNITANTANMVPAWYISLDHCDQITEYCDNLIEEFSNDYLEDSLSAEDAIGLISCTIFQQNIYASRCE